MKRVRNMVLFGALLVAACGGGGETHGSDVPMDADDDAGGWDQSACGPKACVQGKDCFCHKRPPKPPVDVLWVIDDTTSMCRELDYLANQMTNVLRWYRDQDLDVRMAVTTTNVCPKGEAGAVRGAFVYRPAAAWPPSCMEKRTIPCLSDTECQGNPALPDAANWACESVPAQFLWSCDRPENYGTDPYEGDVLNVVNSHCRYRCASDASGNECAANTGPTPCDQRCRDTFGQDRMHCFLPGDDASKSGCLTDPDTAFCPTDGPLVLDEDVADQYFQKWQQGLWSGDPSWPSVPEPVVRSALFERLAVCMVSVQLQQAPCAHQEQGLQAAWMALDKNGENEAQARSFLRDEAFLHIIVVSDEDDCSTAQEIGADDTSRCACLADTNGCTADGQCDAAKPGPLSPTGVFVNRFKALKEDPAKVAFTAIVGDALVGSQTSPVDDPEAIRERYRACRCDSGPYSQNTYVCSSPMGQAALGSRYMEVASAVGYKYLAIHNICNYQWPIQNNIPLLAAFCLPRPLEDGESVSVAILSPEGACTDLKEDVDDHVNDYKVVRNYPVCPKFSADEGHRTENAVQLTGPLAYAAWVQICYQ